MIIEKPLEGSFVCLRSVGIEDAQFTYEVRQNTQKNAFLHKVDQGVISQVEWIKRQRERTGDYFFVALNREKKHIGTCGVYNISGKSGEMGRLLMIGNQIESLETCLILHDFAFNCLKLTLISSYILEENKPALGINRRFGGIEISRTFDDDFQMYMIRRDITIDAYNKEREKLVSLIKRYFNR